MRPLYVKMAERPATPEVQLQASHLSLSCASCGDEVEEVKCLPCLHSLPLCDRAACQQKAFQRGVTCQQCQEEFSVPSGGFAPHPFAGRKAVSKQCEEKEIFCHEDHDEPQKAVSYCPQCPGAICEECVQIHRSKKIYKSHTTVPLSKAVSESSIARKVAFVCEKHAEKQRLYCFECEALICPICHSVAGHKSHSMLFVDGEIGSKNKTTLKSCIASAERSITKTTAALVQVERSIDALHQQSENARANISEVVDRLITVLRDRHAALVGEVDQLEEREGTELRRQKEKLNHQLTELKQFKLLTEDLLQHGIPEEQISLKKNVVQRIVALTAASFSASGLFCSIHFDSSSVKPSLVEELSQLGLLACEASPQNCTMDFPAPVDHGVLLVQKMPFTFAVITRDKNSKTCYGGDRVLATLSPSTCGVPVVGRVEEGGAESYQVQFDTLPAAHCQLSVTVNGGHTRGSPLLVRVRTVQDIGKDVKVFSDPGTPRDFRALAVGSNGCILATDKSNKEVCIFDRTGCMVSRFQLKAVGSDIDGIAEIQDGNIAVSDYSNCIQVYTANGQLVQQFNVSGGPCGLALSASGQLFVAEYGCDKVSVFNQIGHYQFSFECTEDGPVQFKSPEQICIASNGLVYVTDRGNNCVQVFKQDGKFVQKFGRDVLECPTGIAVTKDGHVVVASEADNKLSIFTLEGQCIHEVTDIGLNSPYSVAIDACGWVYVADCDNQRILKL